MSRSGRYQRLGCAAALATVALTAGCGTSKELAAMTCPKVLPAPDADTVALFPPSGAHDARDVQVAARIMDASGTCQREAHGIAVLLEIKAHADRANPGIKDADLPYFVALIDAQQHVLTQVGYNLHVEFLPGETYRNTPAERLTVHLPLKTTAAGAEYSIVVGFQLSPDQLAFNRSQHQPQQ
jgi:hypothetical protein